MQIKPFLSTLLERLPDSRKLISRISAQKPHPIVAFAHEKEVFRKGNVLVTDTRLAYIDPFDRMLKTYMFEHMISLDKRYYRSTAINRRFCKFLLVACIMVLLITFIIDLLDTSSQGFLLVYAPVLFSLFIVLLVWRDMRPKFKVAWRMRDGSTDEISTEPMFREWLVASKRRETFMDELAQAMNEALSAKAWWPATGHRATPGPTSSGPTNPGFVEDIRDSIPAPAKTPLKLVTDKYE